VRRRGLGHQRLPEARRRARVERSGAEKVAGAAARLPLLRAPREDLVDPLGGEGRRRGVAGRIGREAARAVLEERRDTLGVVLGVLLRGGAGAAGAAAAAEERLVEADLARGRLEDLLLVCVLQFSFRQASVSDWFPGCFLLRMADQGRCLTLTLQTRR
jgi:hypothetical protein